MKKRENKNFKYIKALVIVLITFIIFYLCINARFQKIYVPYVDFVNELEQGNIVSVTLNNSNNIFFESNNEEILNRLEASNELNQFDKFNDINVKFRYYTDNPRKEEFKEELLLKGVNVTEDDNTNATKIFSLLFCIVIGYFLFSKLTKKQDGNKSFMLQDVNSNSTGKSNDNALKKKINFSNVAGNEEAKESLIEIIDFLKSPEKYKKYGARMPRGIIFYGPPGTGKTLMAKALANEADVPFYPVSGSDFVQMYVGVGASRIRELFKKAKESEKAVIFIDEIDALAKKRTNARDGGNEERDQTLNALLTEMSGFNESDGIVVIAATNRFDTLDDAILRPGRFDRHIEIGLPDVNARCKILKAHSKNKPIAEDVNIKDIAKETVYFSGAMLENLLNEASIMAAKEDNGCISATNLDKAMSTVIAGREKQDRSYITKDDKMITAYHEVGHTIVTKVLKPDNFVSKVTIIPSSNGSGGYTLNIPKDKLYTTKKDIENEIMILLAGRASEELKFGKENVTTGASNDLARANDLLDKYICNFGMSDKFGLLTISIDLLGKASATNEFGKEFFSLKKELLDDLYTKTMCILENNTKNIDKLAETLIIKEVLKANEIDEILSFEAKNE